MNWVDYAILAILLLSAVVSILRGFTREAISLLGWIVAFWVALTFTPMLADRMQTLIPTPSIRIGVAFVALLMTCLLIAGIVNFLAAKLVDKTGLSGTDRVLGIVFGVVRGMVVVALLVLLAGLTTMPKDPWWGESMLLGHFQVIAQELRALLPPDVAAQFNF
jgi:membrane protein required for colicin V production